MGFGCDDRQKSEERILILGLRTHKIQQECLCRDTPHFFIKKHSLVSKSLR